MKIVTYRVTLLEPALVTSLDGDPNSAVAYDYLPGSVLRGVFVGLTMRKEKLSNFDAANPDVRRMFFNGETRFLNGYMVVDGKRSLPAPRSWEQDKHAQSEAEKIKITDRALAQPQGSDAQDKELGKPKSLGGKFCALVGDGTSAYVVEPPHVINVHTERDRKRGRSLGGDRGTIYRYDALAAGLVFEALILCDYDADAAYFEALLDEDDYRRAIIGGARSAGYGRVQLGTVQAEGVRCEVDGEMPLSSELILTLLSDVILRDKDGQYAPNAETLRKVVAAHLDIDADKLSVASAFKGEGMVGGFNRKWGLPLPQVPTLTMGSVFVFKLSDLSEEQIKALQSKLEWRGIGERRAEGFGRVVVNWQQHGTLEKRDLPESVSKTEITLSSETKQVWDTMQARIKRQQVDQHQLAKANTLNLRRLPPTSQINRLRQIVTWELLKLKPDTTVIGKFLTDIAGKKAEQHFGQALVDGKSLKTWLQDLIKEPDKYAALRLIDATLARAAKLKKQEDSRLEVKNV